MYESEGWGAVRAGVSLVWVDGVESCADFVIVRVADDFVCLSGALFDGVGGLGHWLVEDA